jgi:prepilin-type N-terminal cleavage/methylation domain-containing protein
MRQRGFQQGFTLIEIMMVVALIAVLAAIAIPSYVRQSARAKSDAEVTEVFAELRMRQEQLRFEQGAYLATAATEADLYPAGPTAAEQLLAPLPAAWTALRYRGRDRVRCSYGVITGLANTGPPASIALNSFGFGVQTTDWYYILAICNLDNDATVNGLYLTDNNNTAIRKLNAGR